MFLYFSLVNFGIVQQKELIQHIGQCVCVCVCVYIFLPYIFFICRCIKNLNNYVIFKTIIQIEFIQMKQENPIFFLIFFFSPNHVGFLLQYQQFYNNLNKLYLSLFFGKISCRFIQDFLNISIKYNKSCFVSCIKTSI